MNWKTQGDFLINGDIVVSDSPEETFSLGQRIAELLSPGSVIALKGALGSGKTCLAKGIARGIGVTDNITSPTYTIINEYHTNDIKYPVLYHIDAYRLNDDKDFEDIGGTEVINSGRISIIEWSERIPKSLPDNAIIVSFEITGPTSRLIQVTGLALA